MPPRHIAKVALLISTDIALYKADQDHKRINHYHQLPKKLRKPLTK